MNRDPAREVLCRRVAANQQGVVTRAQLRELGLSDRSLSRRLRTGELRKAYAGIYVWAVTPDTWRRRVECAYQWSRGAGVVSHGSAARLWSLVLPVTTVVELTVPGGRTAPSPDVLVYGNQLARPDVITRDGIRATSIARTLLDLCATLSEPAAEAALDDALRRRITTVARLDEWINERAAHGRRGLRLFRRLLELRDTSAPLESPLETRFFRFLRKHGLPLPVPQFEIATGGSYARVDFAYPHARLAVEIDGYAYHSGRREWEHDLNRRNRLTLVGWRIIHVTARRLSGDPVALADEIQTALVLST